MWVIRFSLLELQNALVQDKLKENARFMTDSSGQAEELLRERHLPSGGP